MAYINKEGKKFDENLLKIVGRSHDDSEERLYRLTTFNTKFPDVDLQSLAKVHLIWNFESMF